MSDLRIRSEFLITGFDDEDVPHREGKVAAENSATKNTPVLRAGDALISTFREFSKRRNSDSGVVGSPAGA